MATNAASIIPHLVKTLSTVMCHYGKRLQSCQTHLNDSTRLLQVSASRDHSQHPTLSEPAAESAVSPQELTWSHTHISNHMSRSCSSAESVWPELLLQSNMEQVSGKLGTQEAKSAEVTRPCPCSLTRCRRVSSPWNNRSLHSRPTWKALEKPFWTGLQENLLRLKRPALPVQRQARRQRRPRIQRLHLHPFLPQTQMPRGHLCPFPPLSDDCINPQGRNDVHQARNRVFGATEHFQMLIICWLTVDLQVLLFFVTEQYSWNGDLE